MAKKSKSTKAKRRKLIGLVSAASGHRIYTWVNPQNRTLKGYGKLSLRRYDPLTRKHETFEETKKNLGRNEVKPRKK